MVLESEKKLSDYFKPSDDARVFFKDLGPQVNYKTVFFWEYLGTMVLYALFYLFPKQLYPWSPGGRQVKIICSLEQPVASAILCVQLMNPLHLNGNLFLFSPHALQFRLAPVARHHRSISSSSELLPQCFEIVYLAVF